MTVYLAILLLVFYIAFTILYQKFLKFVKTKHYKLRENLLTGRNRLEEAKTKLYKFDRFPLKLIFADQISQGYSRLYEGETKYAKGSKLFKLFNTIIPILDFIRWSFIVLIPILIIILLV